MPQSIDLEGLARVLIGKSQEGRTIAAVAGPPGSGKSTLAERLVERINAEKPGSAVVLPMDGFHYDDGLLNAMGRRAHKGAPDTFDVGGLRHVLLRLRANDEDAVAVPVFDRDIEISRGSARLIAKDIPVIIVEGNYLLLRRDPWSALRPLFDVTVMVATGVETLKQRLAARWESYNLPPEEIRRKLEDVDLPNGRFVMAESAAADLVIAN